MPTSTVEAELKRKFRYCRNNDPFEMTIAPSECSELLGHPSAKRQRDRVVREINF